MLYEGQTGHTHSKLVLNYDYLQFRSQVHREYMTGLSELMFT